MMLRSKPDTKSKGKRGGDNRVGKGEGGSKQQGSDDDTKEPRSKHSGSSHRTREKTAEEPASTTTKTKTRRPETTTRTTSASNQSSPDSPASVSNLGAHEPEGYQSREPAASNDDKPRDSENRGGKKKADSRARAAELEGQKTSIEADLLGAKARDSERRLRQNLLDVAKENVRLVAKIKEIEASVAAAGEEQLEGNRAQDGTPTRGSRLAAQLAEETQRRRLAEDRCQGLEKAFSRHKEDKEKISRQLSEHESANKALQEQMGKRQNDNDTLRLLVSEQKDAIKVLQEQLAKQQHDNDTLKDKLSEHQGTNSALQEQVAKQQDEDHTLKERESKHDSANTALQEQMLKQQNENGTLKEKLSEHESTNRALQESVVKQQEDNTDMALKLIEREKEAKQLQRLVSELQSDKEDLCRQVSRLGTQSAALSDEVATGARDINEQRDLAQKAREDAKSKQVELEDLRSQLAASGKEAEKSRLRIEEMMEDLKRQTASATTYRSRATDLAGQLEAVHEKMEHEVETMRNQLDESEDRSASLDAGNQRLQTELDSSSENVRNLENRNKQLQSEFDEARVKAALALKNAEALLQKSEEQASEAQRECNVLQEQLDNARHEDSIRRDELERLKSQAEISKKEISELEQRVKQISASEATLRSGLAAQAENENSSIQRYQEMAARAESRVRDLEAEGLTLTAKLQETVLEAEKIGDRAYQAEATVQALETEHLSLNAQLKEARLDLEKQRAAASDAETSRSTVQEAQRLSLTAKLEEAMVDARQREEMANEAKEKVRELENACRSLTEQLEQAELAIERHEEGARVSEACIAMRAAEVLSLGVQLDEARVEVGEQMERAKLEEAKAKDLEWSLEMERKRTQNSAAQRLQQLAEVRELRDKLSASKAKGLELQQRIERGEAEKNELEATISAVCEELDLKESELATVTASYETVRRGGDVVTELESKLKCCQGEIAGLKGKLKEQEGFILAAQDASRQKMKDDEEDKSQMTDDETLKSCLRVDIEDAARQWAGRYAPRSLPAAGLPESAYEEMREQFGAVNGAGDMASLCSRYDADIVVHAMLSCFVTEQVLNRPFLVFQLEGSQGLAEQMAKWYQDQLQVDKQRAYRWRYQELRWLSKSILPKLSNSLTEDPAAEPAGYSNFFTGLAQSFISGSARHLVNHEAAQSPSSIRHLSNVFRKAAQVGLMIWRQPFEVEIKGYDELHGHNPTSDSADAEVRTHSSQLSSKGGPPDTAIVDLVVQPCVVGRPEPGAQKVWGEAIVLWQ